MRQYELTYLISDNVPENDLNKVTGKVGGYIKDCGGELLKEEIWGRRKLAYPIQKQEFATYVTVSFDLPSEKAKEFEHNIIMTSKIVRHLMIVKEVKKEELVLTAEDIAETKEIEKVVGGEKSFESVRGETEESKNLMSVHGDKEEPKSEMDHEPFDSAQGRRHEPRKEEVEVAEPFSAKATDNKEEEKSEVEAEKPKKEKKAAPAKKVKKEDEADRLSKLDKELDDILGEDL